MTSIVFSTKTLVYPQKTSIILIEVDRMYFSTRGNECLTASQAIIKGLASDGGLFIFDKLPNIRFNEDFLKLDYKSLAKKILKAFLDDYTEEEISYCVESAYNDISFKDEEVSFDLTDSFGFLKLYNGPTFAFKDMALQILPYLLSVAKKKNNIKEHTVILTATSGDTGSAALCGFSALDDISVIVLYPHNAISKIQEAQMLSFNASNAISFAVDGNFDDCQRAVKDIFNTVRVPGVSLSSANSINIGRLIPQVVYYIYTYISLVNNKKIKYGEKINFSVPTGNFGNILACYIAKMIGTPINHIICASNKNNVLTDFFKSGEYNANRHFYVTNSPSMDILVSSNLERLLYLMTNDKVYVKSLMYDLNQNGFYKVNPSLLEKLKEIEASYVDEEKTEEGIRKLYQEKGILIDPHTSVAYMGFNDIIPKGYTICVSTASPYKFPIVVAKSLGINNNQDEFELIDNISKVTNILPDARILALKNVEIKPQVCKKNEIKEMVVRKVYEYAKN